MQTTHTPVILGPNFNEVDSVSTSSQQTDSNWLPRFATGFRATSKEGGEFMYVKFISAITECQVCVLTFNTTTSEWEAAAITTTNADALLGNQVGVAVASAGAASGNYGWVQTLGLQHILVAQNAQNNTQLNTTATAGVIDDDGTAASTLIMGCYLQADAPNTTGPHKARAFLNYPTLGIEDPS